MMDYLRANWPDGLLAVVGILAGAVGFAAVAILFLWVVAEIGTMGE